MEGFCFWWLNELVPTESLNTEPRLPSLATAAAVWLLEEEEEAFPTPSTLPSCKAVGKCFLTSPSLSFWTIPMTRLLLTVYIEESLECSGK